MTFQRSIGPFGLLFVGISSVIGSGWLFGPLYAAQIAGPAAVLSWIIGGLLMSVIALTFAELGSAFPSAGGMIQFAHDSHGPLVSFVIGWMVWVSSLAVAPVETLGLVQYTANYIPGVMTMVNNAHVLTYPGIALAAFVMFIMCILNYYSAKFFSRSNNVITAIKLIVPTLTVILLISMKFHMKNFTAATGGFVPFGWHGVFAALPLGGVIYSFIGSNTVLQLAGETKNPQLSIPLALIGSMFFCIVLYMFIQIAFIGALEPSALAAGWKNLHFSGDHGPFAGLMAAIGLSWFVMVIYADALISPFGTGFVFTASTARIGYSLSKIGFLPKAIEKLTPRGVPLRSIIVNYCIGLLLFLPFPAWQKLVSFIISCFIISYIIGPLALVSLRKSHPNERRPFLLPCANFISLVAFYICNLLIFWTGWTTVYRMMIALLIGVVFFAVHCYREKNNLWSSQWAKSWWLIPYFVFMTILSYLGSFGGGKNVMPFGMDFVFVGLLTVIVFYLSLQAKDQEAVASKTLFSSVP